MALGHEAAGVMTTAAASEAVRHLTPEDKIVVQSPSCGFGLQILRLDTSL